jgi:uncharacterized repeat protein (TIGR01451 family)
MGNRQGGIAMNPISGQNHPSVGGMLVPLGVLGVALLVLGLAATGSAAPASSTDLSITKSDSPDPVRVGSLLTYTIAVENRGPLAATGVTVTDSLPKGVDLVSATPSAGLCGQRARKVTCAISEIPFGVSYAGPTLSIVVIPREAGTITNKVSISADQKDSVRANNSATATTRVIAAATCRGATATVTGTPTDDVLAGTGGRDVIVAFGGNDTIRSRAGQDLICAGTGNDLVAAGTAADRVFSTAGKDRVFGGGGPDLLRGGRGNDVLRGNRGADRLRGGSGFDRCRGGAGLDSARSCER